MGGGGYADTGPCIHIQAEAHSYKNLGWIWAKKRLKKRTKCRQGGWHPSGNYVLAKDGILFQGTNLPNLTKNVIRPREMFEIFLSAKINPRGI